MYCSKQYKIRERQSYFSNIYLTIKFYALVKALKWKVSITYWINGTASNYIYHWYFDKHKTKTKNLHELLYNLILYFNYLNLQFRYFRGLLQISYSIVSYWRCVKICNFFYMLPPTRWGGANVIHLQVELLWNITKLIKIIKSGTSCLISISVITIIKWHIVVSIW